MNSKILIGIIAFVIVAGLGGQAFAQEMLYQVNAALIPDSNLHVIDASDGSFISSVPVTLAGQTVIGFSGLAQSSSGQLWALMVVESQPERLLVTIDPTTGVATLIGDTGDKFTNLAFDASGTLYTNSAPGDNGISAPPHYLHTLDKSNGNPTQVCDLPFAGQFGTALAINPVTNSLFYGEGDNPSLFHELTNIGTDPCGFTNIPLLVSSFGDFNAIVWSPGNSAFYLGTGFDTNQLWNLPANGQNSLIGSLSVTRVTGLALFPTGQIGDTVFHDLNDNGVQDLGEPGIPLVTVNLAGTAVATTNTDANGKYLFTNLLPGGYTVMVDENTLPLGFKIGSNCVDTFALAPLVFGQSFLLADFCYITTTATPAIGGEIIPIEQTSLLLAGAQSFSWMIPVVLSVLGIGLFVVSRKSENS